MKTNKKQLVVGGQIGRVVSGVRRYALARVLLFAALFVCAVKSHAQTNSYGIPDASSLTSTVSAPFNAAAGWFLGAVAFLIVSGWVIMMLRRKR